MAITEDVTAFVDPSATKIDLSQVFGVSASGGDPKFLVLTALDRNEYAAGASGATGSFSGNGHTETFTSLGGDARGAGIVFAYQAATGRYYNSTFGYFDDLAYLSSASAGDVTSLSLFGTSALPLATAYASDAYDLMQVDAAGYLGSATVVTQPGFTGTVPAQATPDAIAAAAEGFVGQAWNMDGCWTLTSTIAAEAGTSLPVQSTLIGLPGQPNGEWIVAYDGRAGQSGNWQAMVTAGEMVVIGTPGGGGHITTIVSGSGGRAMLVDNVTYVNAGGQVMNAANDGSSSDVLVAPPHPASQEWAGVQAASVVIYELDTPIVTARAGAGRLAEGASESLGPLFSATDPGGKAVTEWQVYDTAISDQLLDGNAAFSDHAAASALTVASLAAVSLLAGSGATTDALDVRAFNGSYWGDWQTLGVTIAAATAGAPVLLARTQDQTWLGGRAFALTIPGNTFTDPRNQALTFTATQANGDALPGWLHFDAATDSFTGTAPATAQTLGVRVTATDAGGRSVTDTFSATVIGAPVVTAPTASQIVPQGGAVSLTLPANAFTDPQGEALTTKAALSGGQALPDWLSFNPATETFSGTAPNAVQNLGITVTATDTSGLSASETFNIDIAQRLKLAAATPNQTWDDGQAVNFRLPTGTFADAPGQRMTFAAYQTSGPNVTSWLRFNPAMDALLGTVPATLRGTVGLAVVATDALHMSVADLFDVTFAAGTGQIAAVSAAGSAGMGMPPAAPHGAELFALHS